MAIHSAGEWIFDQSTLWENTHLPCHIIRKHIDSPDIIPVIHWLNKNAGKVNIDWKYVSIFDMETEMETLHIAVRDTEIVLLFNLAF